MAMSVTLTGPGSSLVNQNMTFVAKVANSSAGNVNLQNLQPIVTLADGVTPFRSAIISGPWITAQQAVAVSASGFQNNVVIPAAGNVSFVFNVLIPGPALATGVPGTANDTIMVSCICSSDDGSVFVPNPTVVMALSPPMLGQTFALDSKTAIPVGMLNFSNGSQSSLIF